MAAKPVMAWCGVSARVWQNIAGSGGGASRPHEETNGGSRSFYGGVFTSSSWRLDQAQLIEKKQAGKEGGNK